MGATTTKTTQHSSTECRRFRKRSKDVGTVVTLSLALSLAFVSAQQGGGDYQNYGGYQDYQEYQDYSAPNDKLYADIVGRQQDMDAPKGGGGGGGGAGIGKMIVAGGLGWFLGAKVHSSRSSKKLKTKHMKEQKALYTQYYNDVYKLQEQNAELAYVVEQLQVALQKVETDREMEALQRDYTEFKQPDIDGDDRISRAEFNMYVKNYLSNYPGLTEKDYPKFEDFDHDGDGYVSFQEYAQQMALQVQKAEQEQYQASKSGKSSSNAKSKTQAVKSLYGETQKAVNFDDLYANFRR